jgi:ParB family chromosome partitioning protein
MTFEARRSGGGLGRGLAALIPQRENGRSSSELPISAISRNPHQPRTHVDPAELEELASSIAEHGVLQPILVTETATGYQLVAGERRLRAAQMAGLERIPALVRVVVHDEHLALALVENLQRSDLNAVDEARAFHQLIAEFGLTQDEVGSRVGRSRSGVANTLRLLELAPAVQAAVESGAVTEGHARALGGLLTHEEQLGALAEVTEGQLSVRQTEDLVRRRQTGASIGGRRRAAHTSELEQLENGLREALGTKVNLHPRRKGGLITIEYYDEDDLGRIYERLTGAPR